LGHSDADALCHAITDALFGAAALGDIGHHFPDTDAQYKGADSLALLAEAGRRIKSAGWQVGNVDANGDRAGAAVGAARSCHAPVHRPGARRQPRSGQREGEDRRGPGSVGKGESMEARAVCLLWRG
jgi:2-C-methyl-D-erythritol 2,4-cyclodiphosphate synthase